MVQAAPNQGPCEQCLAERRQAWAGSGVQILNYHPHVTCIPCCILAVWREAAAFETHTFEALEQEKV